MVISRNLIESKNCLVLDFRDLKLFKLAFLVKQERRLIHSIISLLFKVYKAKYFSKYSFLKTRLGARTSLRSILATRYVQQICKRWRIGIDHNIFIYGDRWIPRKKRFKVICKISSYL